MFSLLWRSYCKKGSVNVSAIKFLLKNTTFEKKTIDAIKNRISKELIPKIDPANSLYNDEYDCLSEHLSNDALASMQKIADQCISLAPTICIVLGIGGSNLGAKAALHAVMGRRSPYNGMQFFF